MNSLSTYLLSLWSRVLIGLGFFRRHLKKTVAIIAIVLVAWISYAVSRPKKIEYVTAVAVKGDLHQLVEAVGTVTSEKALDLQFSGMDVVSQVYVKEGDMVKAGQKLAQLRSGSLSASIASASANVQSAKAALQALEEGSRPEDIAIAEAQVANKRASLEAVKQTLANSDQNLATALNQLSVLKNETAVNLSGQVGTAGSTISQQLATAKTALLAVRGVFDANDVQDAIVKNNSAGYDSLQLSLQTTIGQISSAQSFSSPSDYQNAIKLLSSARSIVSVGADLMNRSYDLVSTLPLTAYFTSTSRETNKSTIALQKTYVQSALSTLDTALKTIQDASASYNSKIVAQEAEISSLKGTRDRSKADIATYETSLRIDEASLALKKAPARQTDIDSARARVRQAQADVARAVAQYNDTIIFAPVEGKVTKVNAKAGQIRPSTEPSITMLGNTPFRIEMFVSEVDIPKVASGQTGSILLDAFRDSRFPLRVSEIDSAATDKDGVPKYRVKLDFSGLKTDLKVGMTGDAEIVTGFRSSVISVPARSVIERGTGSIVRIQKNGTIEERSITTGMEGEGGALEVMGVEEGETVIVLEKK